jgi:hypothetical protein
MRPEVLAALAAYQQADEEGVMVLVSRQALDEAISTLRDLYALGLMAEEMGEVIQLVGKWLRFGPDHARNDGESARSLLPMEMGDVAAAMDFASLDGIAPFPEVIARREAKKAKLLSPDSRDDQGGRLAPEPRGQYAYPS